LLSSVIRAAAAANRPLSICGEMAGYPAYAARFMKMGVSTVSVSPRLIPEVRRAATNHAAFS
jgi:phosphotransferase system enzyme I (PtsI)